MTFEGIDEFVSGRSYQRRQEWFVAVNGAADHAERTWRTLRSKKEERLRGHAEEAFDFLEQAKAVLFYLHHDQWPFTDHVQVAPAIEHIRRCLSTPRADVATASQD